MGHVPEPAMRNQSAVSLQLQLTFRPRRVSLNLVELESNCGLPEYIETMMNDEINAVEFAVELTAAWLASPNTRTNADDVPAFLLSMHAAVSRLSDPSTPSNREEPAETYEPAVTTRKSLASPDHIISLIDGKSYKTLRRHLSTHGLTPAEYRARYNLKDTYPMVAPTYSEARRTMAKSIGLGRKLGQSVQKASGDSPKAVRKPRAGKVTQEA
jgi:predicted transcriptional regulator